MEGGGGRRRRRRGRLLPLLALQTAIEYSQLDRKPPVTAALLLANTLVHLHPRPLHPLLPLIHDVWFNPHLILKNRDLKRFFLSAFYHMGETHLFYNMLSLLWKGTQLEISMGSTEFASMVVALIGMSQGITLLLAKMLLLVDYDGPYYREYSVGFSGVLFAMKVVLSSQSGDFTYMHGLVVPSRYAAWAELFIIQLFIPNVSFLGHLGGVLAGILYLKLKRCFRGPDPLTSLIRSFIHLAKWPLRFAQGLFLPRRNRITGQGTVGDGGFQRHVPGVWRCPACTYDNDVWEDVCEMCLTERSGGRHMCLPSRPTHSDVLNSEELRRRRLERFG